jgi:glutamyl-tRNA synthetase
MKEVRTRFAPSPTGFLHIGGVRTALFNYLFTKQREGQFILRLEDTDRERFVSDGVEQIVEALDWLGLKPDEGFWISEGKHQNIEYVQSERHKAGFYKKFAEELVNKGLAYYSPSSPQKLGELRQEAKQTKKPFIYRRSFDKANTNQALEKTPIRLDVEAAIKELASESIGWNDKTRGDFEEDLRLIEDFILIKSDGFPTYNFANVIDDHDMKISHVIRGDEFIASTGKHVLLYNLFGWELPEFVHLPVINGTDGKKLSKRTGDTDVLDYRNRGYLPEALLNFLALLGWNDSTEQEIFSMDELVEKFQLEQINSSPAIFDPKRLDWMNGHYIRQLPLDKLYEKSKDFWPVEASKFDEDYKKKVLALVQERLKYFTELSDLTRFFFTDLPVEPSLISEHKQLKKLSKEELKDLLEQSRDALQITDFNHKSLTNALNDLLEKTGQKPVVLFSLIRIATTQAPASPELAPTLAVLGKEKTQKRIENQINSL